MQADQFPLLIRLSFEIIRHQKNDTDGQPENCLDPVMGLKSFDYRNSEKEKKYGKVGAQLDFFH